LTELSRRHGSRNTSGEKFCALNKQIIAKNIQKSDAGRPWENGGPAPEEKIKTTRIEES